jgi:hypothetical protein
VINLLRNGLVLDVARYGSPENMGVQRSVQNVGHHITTVQEPNLASRDFSSKVTRYIPPTPSPMTNPCIKRLVYVKISKRLESSKRKSPVVAGLFLIQKIWWYLMNLLVKVYPSTNKISTSIFKPVTGLSVSGFFIVQK